jgi:hypothetical protein
MVSFLGGIPLPSFGDYMVMWPWYCNILVVSLIASVALFCVVCERLQKREAVRRMSQVLDLNSEPSREIWVHNAEPGFEPSFESNSTMGLELTSSAGFEPPESNPEAACGANDQFLSVSDMEKVFSASKTFQI